MPEGQQTIQDFMQLQNMLNSYSGESGSFNNITINPQTGLPEEYGNLLAMMQQGMGSLGDTQFQQTSQYANLYANLYNQLRDTYSDAELQDALGQFQQFAPQYQAAQQDMISQNRQDNLSDVASLAGLMRQGDEAATDPRVRALRDQMLKQAESDLSAGGNMSADQQRRSNEAIRSSLGARGIGQGASGAGRESLANLVQGDSLRRERQGFAQGVIDSESAKQRDPFATILGSPNQSASFGSNVYQQSAFAPSTQGVPDFFGQAFNLGGMAQGQQQYSQDTRMQQLAIALGLGNADQFGIDTGNLPQLV